MSWRLSMRLESCTCREDSVPHEDRAPSPLGSNRKISRNKSKQEARELHRGVERRAAGQRRDRHLGARRRGAARALRTARETPTREAARDVENGGKRHRRAGRRREAQGVRRRGWPTEPRATERWPIGRRTSYHEHTGASVFIVRVGGEVMGLLSQGAVFRPIEKDTCIKQRYLQVTGAFHHAFDSTDQNIGGVGVSIEKPQISTFRNLVAGILTHERR